MNLPGGRKAARKSETDPGEGLFSAGAHVRRHAEHFSFADHALIAEGPASVGSLYAHVIRKAGKGIRKRSGHIVAPLHRTNLGVEATHTKPG